MNGVNGTHLTDGEVSPPLRVLVIDNHAVMRRALQYLLQGRPEIAIVGDASSATEAIERCGTLQPDVAIMDLHLPDGSGVGTCREIRDISPHTQVLILAAHADQEALFDAVMAGASGYVLKDTNLVSLQEAVITVGHGGSLLDPQMATEVLDRLRAGVAGDPEDEALSSLSPQEERILYLIADGMTNSQIARELAASERTIKNYVSEIYAKLNVERRSQAAAIAAQHRLRRQQ